MNIMYLQKSLVKECWLTLQNKSPEYVFEKYAKSNASKKVKTHYDYQKCAKEKKGPQNESPEEIMIARKTTYSLKNGKSSRELSHSKVLSEISTYPLKEFVIDTMWIDCILPSGLINKYISCISHLINRHYLLSETNGQLVKMWHNMRNNCLQTNENY